MARNAVAELEKLAYQLNVELHELDFLAELPAEDLHELRGKIADALFEADRHHFVKIAALSKSIPSAVAAKVTEFALPPIIGARTAELLEPAKAIDLVGRISDSYLARVSAAMDPGRAAHLIEVIPAEKIAMVGRELARNNEWVIIGGFVSYVTEAGLRTTVNTFTGEQLLRIGFVLDDTARLSEIARMLTDKQVDEMLAAAQEFDLWRELDELATNIDAAEMARMAQRLGSASQATQDAVRAATVAGQLSADTAAKLSVAPSAS
jgi:hypothetical protein